MSKKLLTKSMQQSPIQESFSTTPRKSFIGNLLSGSLSEDEKKHIQLLERDNVLLKKENLELRKELQQFKEYKTKYTEAAYKLQSSEKTCNCDYCDYLEKGNDHLFNVNNLLSDTLSNVLTEIIQKNEILEYYIKRTLTLEKTCKESNIPIPNPPVYDELDQLVQDIQRQLENKKI